MGLDWQVRIILGTPRSDADNLLWQFAVAAERPASLPPRLNPESGRKPTRGKP